MLFVITLKNDREKDILMKNIKYARENYSYYVTYFRNALVEDEGKLDLLLEQEKDGARKIVWRGSVSIDALNHLLSIPLVMTLIREGRWKIWVPEENAGV